MNHNLIVEYWCKVRLWDNLFFISFKIEFYNIFINYYKMSWICNEIDCTKQSLYAFKNNKPEYCGLHKKDNIDEAIKIDYLFYL